MKSLNIDGSKYMTETISKIQGEIYYAEVLEAIGAFGSRATISNKLNKVFAKSPDEKLRRLVGELLSEIPQTSINLQVITLRSSSVLSTKKIELYCRISLGRDTYQEPLSKV